ncbi:hypothetical protein GCM10011494_29540 [Novosphingobium endophyticum]|uniref:Cytochrome c domain-containing protein n=1 Tax=Novosphingobium endophyticum TaxID=1955250 RepID=A0A916TVD1_9SPHN|nr:c-type cytochrome [Novosphingobium endophyticum]GGC08973.1 hypothetical protein GCM10011494_29540 [Novosphingobium endophyticum]
MRFRLLLTGVSFALLAACGAPETDSEATSAADLSETPDAPPQDAGTDTATAPPPATTDAAPVAAPAATATSPSPTEAVSPSAVPATAPATRTEIAATKTAPPAAFAQCRACHSVEAGKNGVGPTLFGIFGSKAGEVPGYKFSPALARSGITWNRSSLDTWLKGPIKMVPGAKMVIAMPDPEKRKAIIDYLETLK